jgi:hypothetical protein
MDKNIILYFIILIVIIVLYRGYQIKNSKYEIPRIIWTHWDNMESAPLLIKNILELRESKLKDWEIHVLTNSNIDQYINKDVYPKNYNMLMPSQKSDWIRLYLLNKYGGLWLDAGIIINNEIEFNKIYDTSVLYQSELTGFYLDGSIVNNDPTTFYESWYIMAPKNSRIIKKWFKEFEYAIDIGFLAYKKEIIKKGVNVDKIFIFGHDDTYLTIHATLQKLLQLKEIKDPNMILYRAEDTMFKLHIDCNWNSDCIYNKIKNESIKDIPYIKLRGTDRKDGNFILI